MTSPNDDLYTHHKGHIKRDKEIECSDDKSLESIEERVYLGCAALGCQQKGNDGLDSGESSRQSRQSRKSSLHVQVQFEAFMSSRK